MMTRRQFNTTSTVLTSGVGLPACTGSGDSYDAAVQRTWRLGDVPALPPTELQRELVRLATLAPSSHNTQCWRFAIESAQRISLRADQRPGFRQ